MTGSNNARRIRQWRLYLLKIKLNKSICNRRRFKRIEEGGVASDSDPASVNIECIMRDYYSEMKNGSGKTRNRDLDRSIGNTWLNFMHPNLMQERTDKSIDTKWDVG